MHWTQPSLDLDKSLSCYEIQSNFNGSNTFGTKKICSRQGQFEPLRVCYGARSGGIKRDIFSIFFSNKVYCVYS